MLRGVAFVEPAICHATIPHLSVCAAAAWVFYDPAAQQQSSP